MKITNIEDFKIWMQIYCQDTMAIDFETTSLSYPDMEFVGFSLCNGKESCYVADPKALSILKRILHTGTWIMHNSVFDMKCMQKFMGIKPKNIFCTMVASFLLDENRPAYSLKYLAEHDLHVHPDKIKSWEQASKDIHSSQFAQYAENDAIWTYKLFKKYRPLLHKDNLEHLFYKVEMPFQYVLRDLELNGVKVDRKRLGEFKHEVKEILVNLEKDMLSILGRSHDIQCNLFGDVLLISPINFNSSDQLVDVVESLGMEITERTKPSKTFPKGKKSFNKDVKERLKGEHPFIDLIIRYHKLSTLYANFILKAEEFIDEDDRIRPSYRTVRTGRLSCSKPNLQNLPNPKRERLEFNHRELFVPDEGNVFIKADWSGQELRVLAEVSKDDNMLHAFNMDYDLHLYTANRIFNLSLDELDFKEGSKENRKAKRRYKRERFQAKNGVNFPVIYGAFPKRIAKENNVSVDEATRWLEGFYELYPKVKTAKDWSNNQLKRFRYVSTLMGRRRRFPHFRESRSWEQKKMERQAFNMKIQGFSADAMKIAAAKMLPILSKYDSKIVLTVHDELLFECPEEKSKEFAQVVKEVMEHSVAISVPLPVEVDIVNNYGE